MTHGDAADWIKDQSDQEHEAADRDLLEHLQAKCRQLESECRRLRGSIGEQKELAMLVADAVKAADPVKFPAASRSKKKPPVTAVIVLSDWHIGEVISITETEGFGEFSYEIAEHRIGHIADSFIDFIDAQRGAYKIDECVIVGIGDYIAGDIHRELSVTAEFPVPVQTAKAGILFGETIQRIASAFSHVTVHAVGADNHGRLTPKPQAKQKTQNNMSYLVHTIASAHLRNQSNVTMVEAVGMKHLAEIEGWRFLIEHGDNFRGWMGIPYYGLSRARDREARRRMNTDKGFHYHLMGHWHVPAIIEGQTIINGSLSGASEYDHANGRHADPAQIAFLVGGHGLFGWVPFGTKGI